MAEPLGTPEGPVSDTSAAPFGAKLTENAPGPALLFTTTGDNVPFDCTAKTSMSFVNRSVTARNRPSGLTDKDAAPEVLVLRNRMESGIAVSVPCPNVNPTTLLLPPVLSTYTRFPCCATAFGSLPPEFTLSRSDSVERPT